ncbi:hypothetical protein [Methylibium rhizosphaerae]|uniref:hypothetical protein n=1 Tax=Methylibium rhizosphaerae TaxID=2570323 RepID=UPI001C614333|nr:hypothetical protein [Methylibium rhizosphaerae]
MSTAAVISSADATRSIVTRFLQPADVPALLALEARQWTARQAADAATMHKRIDAYPQLCVGAFCAETGAALASLFMKPTSPEAVKRARCWEDCARLDDQPSPRHQRMHSLFGISLTSVDGAAAWSLIRFFWPHALKQGWRDIYLGSPMPGFRRACELERQLAADHYARLRRGGLPLDPQLRYYHRKGFRKIVSVRPGYFPHEQSLDHGAVLRARVPLAALWPLWRRVPLPLLQRFSNLVTALL